MGRGKAEVRMGKDEKKLECRGGIMVYAVQGKGRVGGDKEGR